MLTSTHWGTYEVELKNGRVARLKPFSEDGDPSPIGPPIADLLDHPTRIMRPAIRRGWLENGPGPAGGKIELYSEVVAGFGYEDCPGHATWNVPDEWAGDASNEFPLHLLGKQPANKLHSQLDPGAWSKAAKVKGREAVEISPRDAAARGIADGDIVEVLSLIHI